MTLLASVLTFALLVATTGCSTGSARGAATVAEGDTIFRYVSIGPNVAVVLGLPLPSAARPHLQEAAPNLFSVRPGHFSGAAGIAFRLTSDGRVAAAVFTYAAEDTNFDAKVASYTESLGPAIRSERDGGRVAHWQDARTRLEVAEGAGGLLAVLMDLASAAEIRTAADMRSSI